MRVARLLAACVLFAPAPLLAQSGTPPRDTTPGAPPPAVFVPPVLLGVPVPLACGLRTADCLLAGILVRSPQAIGRTVTLPRPPGDSSKTNNPFGDYADLGLQLQARIEAKAERNKNERCSASQLLSPFANCRGNLQPNLDFQFSLKSAGTIADRFHVDVDYDAQREFDASNNISVYYEGQPGERLQRVELGNVSFTPPASRYLTSSIPSGNYGIHAIGQFGRMRVRTIAAQQKGNVVQSRQFTVGERTLQGNARDIEDYQVEARRFFFTVDPALFRGVYPRIDLLDRSQLDRLSRSLPDTLRPTRVVLYRLQFGTQPLDPNGPNLALLDGAASGVQSTGRQTYDVLRAGVDYFLDQSNLWFALVRPLNPSNERLAVAYYVRLPGSARDTIWVTTGGTPDLNNRPEPEKQFASLVWDPRAAPGTTAFRREIRSVYRIAGEDLQRPSTRIRIVAGTGDQEQPVGDTTATYLQMLGLAQRNNSAEFDVENRLWPRPGDAVYNLTAGAGDVAGSTTAGIGGGVSPSSSSRIIRDNFLVFPSVQPFALRDSGGLVAPNNPSNSEIYRTPGEYLFSPQHPASVYRIRASYEASGGTEAGALSFGSLQVRRGSERVMIDGRALVRDIDYRVDYELGRISFTRPDTLFRQPRRVDVRFEENPLFAPSPTTMFGITSELPFRNGQLNFTAISQSQRTQFTRPQLGFEPTSSMLAGVSGQFAWEAPWLSRLTAFLPGAARLARAAGDSLSGPRLPASRFSLQGELATSRPQPNAAGQAYVESFEGEGGIPVDLTDQRWYLSSVPARGRSAATQLLDINNAATLAWQTNGAARDGSRVSFTLDQIDPRVTIAGTGFSTPETLLWLTLYPTRIGRYKSGTLTPDWTVDGDVQPGQRWRSLRTVLNASGLDLTRSDYVEFWAFIDTSATLRAHNPTVVLDLGDVSEATLAFRPETLFVTNNGADTLFRGRQPQALDSLNTERDPFSHAFNVGANDIGLPGDLIDTLVVVDSREAGGAPTRKTNVPICRAPFGTILQLGDAHAGCTVGNNRLDEEDIDLDNALNLTYAQREQENLLRYVVDLRRPETYARVGGQVEWQDELGRRTKQWVLIRVPINHPTDSVGQAELRRIRAMRLTMISAPNTENELTQIAIARLRLSGAPWLKRADVAITGVGGDRPAGGYVITSLIGTNDEFLFVSTRGSPYARVPGRDSLHAIFYQSPPHVGDQLETSTGQFQAGQIQINERSLRIQAGNLPKYARAEAYYRFPAGQQNFMGYQQLRLWARGNNRGWGPTGELQLFVKLGRDENNFYLYRTPVNAGSSENAWEPEIRIDFARFFDLRKRLQNSFLQASADSVSCTGIDLALITASGPPPAAQSHRHAACDGGYMVYTVDPGVTPPNLAAVQEMSVGIIRVDSTTGGPTATLPGDTLELWVDDIRLGSVVQNAGFAGQVGINVVAADFADIRLNVNRRDPHFRQLSEQPTFINEQSLEFASTFRLEKLLPLRFGVAIPLTITKSSSDANPLFLENSDLLGRGIEGLRTPRNDVTSYSLSLRRTTPLGNSFVGPLFNNLTATSTYLTGGRRSEYQTGTTRSFNLIVDYLVADSARTARIPGLIDRVLGVLPDFMQGGPIGALRSSVFRWNPTQLRVTSAFAKGTDRRSSFSKPIGALDDSPRLSLSQTNLWRNGSTLELRPTNGLAARWDVLSVRDLRQYGDSNAAALIAGAERGRLLGMDAGFERERALQTSLTFAPQISQWFRPRAEFGTQYSMLRDPNTRYFLPRPGVIGVDSLLAHLDSVRQIDPDTVRSSLTLPRRLSASQVFGTGATIDLGRALMIYARDTSRTALARRLSRVVAPMDVNFNRSLLSAYDAAAFLPPVGFQLGLAGPAGFRSVHGAPASTSGITTTLNASSSLLLPFGTSLINRYRRTVTRNWALRLDSTQARIDGAQTVFPDVSARWTFRPLQLVEYISSLTAAIGYSSSTAATSLPIGIDLPTTGGAPRELREFRTSHLRTYPVNVSIAWGFGGLNTAAGYTMTKRVDSLPGSLSRGTSDELNVDVGRAFKIPRSWGMGIKNDVRARMGYQSSHARNLVYDLARTTSSRLGDQGRTSFNLNADTDLNEALLFTLQASRVITYDNNLNRRVNQFVLSTVLQIQFSAGQR